jgi:chemotaxis protein histidine kinase CheA
LSEILSRPVSTKVKILMVDNLMSAIREFQDLNRNHDFAKCRAYEVLSTSISECHSINYQMEKDVEELEEKIIKMRMVKFENN